MSSGVIGIPSFWAIEVTLSRFGFALKADVSLCKLYWAFIKPYNWDAGSLLLILASYWAYYSALLASACAIAWSIYAYISAALTLAYSTVNSSSLIWDES